MRHVREQVPDVQQLRPEVSAATASVVDRAVAKDLDYRYQDAQHMIADLEEVLAVEAARSGQATGEVTSVLRTLPGETRRRLPWRMQHPARWVASLALLGAIVAIALVAAAQQAHKGTGVPSEVHSSAGLQPVTLSQTAAHDYNPFGTGPENHNRVQNVVDSDPNTTWSTAHYYERTLKKAGGTGLGVYLDASPRVAARAVEIQTPTPGFDVQIYGADDVNSSYPYGDSTPLAARGWHGPLASAENVHDRQRIRLTGSGASTAYRYYLVWLTTLPPGAESASISELTLFK
jgi:serine/threonine-protein kinase